jgi:hypothetical protein
MEDPPEEMKLFIKEAISVERNNPAGINIALGLDKRARSL